MLVREEDIKKLYNNHRLIYYEILKEEFLPLDLEVLKNDKGKSLIELANFTYFHGILQKKQITPMLYGNKEFLDNVEDKIKGLQVGLVKKKTKGYLLEHGGAFGKLIHCMGVPLGNDPKQKLPEYFSYVKNEKDIYETILNTLLIKQKNNEIDLDKYDCPNQAESYAINITEYFNLSFQINKIKVRRKTRERTFYETKYELKIKT